MELEFSADQDELRASIRNVLTRESPVSVADMQATLDGDTLHGNKRFVMEGDVVDELVVVVRDGAVIVPVQDVRTAPVRAIDGSRRWVHASLDGVRVAPDRVLANASVDT